MKLKTQSKKSGMGILGFLGLVVVGFIVINGAVLIIWALRTIDGRPLPLPGKPPVEQGGHIPLDVNANMPARCDCGGNCLEP